MEKSTEIRALAAGLILVLGFFASRTVLADSDVQRQVLLATDSETSPGKISQGECYDLVIRDESPDRIWFERRSACGRENEALTNRALIDLIDSSGGIVEEDVSIPSSDPKILDQVDAEFSGILKKKLSSLTTSRYLHWVLWPALTASIFVKFYINNIGRARLVEKGSARLPFGVLAIANFLIAGASAYLAERNLESWLDAPVITLDAAMANEVALAPRYKDLPKGGTFADGISPREVVDVFWSALREAVRRVDEKNFGT